MTELLAGIFWLALGLMLYPYLVYPPLIRLLAALRPLPEPAARGPDPWPRVTFIISAWNEAAVIGEKLENTLAIDYPRDRFEVLVVSDASTDGTDDIVEEYVTRDPRVRLLRQPERRGKSAGLNRAAAEASGQVLVFSDANAMYEPDAVRELMRGFNDPQVGYVVGAQRYRDPESSSQASEGLYWRMELWLKRWESRFSGVVGGDGAIYSLRRELYRELRDDDISDFVNPLHAVAAGFRGWFNPAAVCWEDAGEGFSDEFRRKRRIVNRTWRAVRRYAPALSLRRHGRFVFALVSHKVIRWFATPLAAGTLVSALLLAPSSGGVYLAGAGAMALSFLMAGAGHALATRQRTLPVVVSLAYYFHLVSLAGMLGVWDELRGVRHTTWQHVRSANGRSG